MTDPSLLAQLAVNGILLAGVYALMAIGLNVIFGVIRVLNMAHGEMLMIGAFAAFWVWRLSGANPFVAFVAMGPVFFAFGYAFQYLVVQRIARSTMPLEDSSLLLTYGLSLTLVALARFAWSADYRSVPFARGALQMADISLPYSRLAAFGAAITITAALIGLLRFTRIGMGIRATAQSRDLAAACGVRPRHVHAVAFGLGAALAGAAGMMLSTLYAVYPDMGVDYSVRAFVIVILGGLGSMSGAFLGAAVLGITETFGSFYFGALPATIIPFLVILVVLLIRPVGLLGSRKREG